MDRIWELHEGENTDMQDRLNIVQKAGEDVRALIKTYTDIDCHELYSNKNDTGTQQTN